MKVRVCSMDFMGGLETTYSLSDGYVRGLQRMGKPSDNLTTFITVISSGFESGLCEDRVQKHLVIF